MVEYNNLLCARAGWEKEVAAALAVHLRARALGWTPSWTVFAKVRHCRRWKRLSRDWTRESPPAPGALRRSPRPCATPARATRPCSRRKWRRDLRRATAVMKLPARCGSTGPPMPRKRWPCSDGLAEYSPVDAGQSADSAAASQPRLSRLSPGPHRPCASTGARQNLFKASPASRRIAWGTDMYSWPTARSTAINPASTIIRRRPFPSRADVERIRSCDYQNRGLRESTFRRQDTSTCRALGSPFPPVMGGCFRRGLKKCGSGNSVSQAGKRRLTAKRKKQLRRLWARHRFAIHELS